MTVIYYKSLRLHSVTGAAAAGGKGGKGGKGAKGGKGNGAKSGKGGGADGISTGQIVNLMSNDAQKILDGTKYLASALVTPIQMVAIFSVLIYVAGWLPGGVGVLYILCLFPPLKYCHINMKALRIQMLFATDHRVTLVNEAINGVRVIKQYAWELPISKAIGERRMTEIILLKKILYYLVCGIQLMMQSTPTITPAIVLILYAKTSDEELDSATAFTILLLFLLLRM